MFAQWNLDLTNLYLTKSITNNLLLPVLLMCVEPNLDITNQFLSSYCVFIIDMFCVLCFSSAELVGYVTLRLFKPMCRITPAWCEENLLSATKRVLSILHTLSVPPSALGAASSNSSTELLSAPAFAFCFPLLRCLLREGGKALGGDEDLRHQALQVVAEHCKLRASYDDDDEEEDENEVNEEFPNGNLVKKV